MTFEEIAKTYAVMGPAFIQGAIHMGEEFRRYEKLEFEIRQLTGHDLEQLRKLFAAGYTLKPPDPPIPFNQLVEIFEEGMR